LGNATRISVITPCLNSARYIAVCVESVLKESHGGAEHVVVDGGSSDGTLAALQRYPHLKLCSGPDHGMYDALNKGLALSRGDIIGFLNSDDCYADGAFSSLERSFSDATVMAVVGEAVFFRESENNEADIVARFDPTNADLLELATLRSPVFNSWFFRRSVFAEIGNFDASYRIAGDREFMLRFALSGLRYIDVDTLICRYRIHPGSMTLWANDAVSEEIVSEHIQMTDRHLRRPDVCGRARKLISEACTRDTLRMAFRSIRRREASKVIRYAAAGTRHNPAWMLRFVKLSVGALLRRTRGTP
jgi:glycosyltransferase involved in cell wall biosynthesis